MFVLVSDFKEQMEEDYSLTKEAVIKVLPEDEVKNLKFVVAPYQSPEFEEAIKKADGLITAFLPVDQAFLEKAPKLKYISINAAGYSNVDMAAVKEHGVTVSHIREYCTREVSEHALSLLMTINNNINRYGKDIEHGNWNYNGAPMRPTLDKLTIAIFGFGKIGKYTTTMLKMLGARVCFVDPYVTVAEGNKHGAVKASVDQVNEEADVIINHMALTDSNYHMFDYNFFTKCKKKPIFINVGRGGCVDEDGLLKVLEEGLVYGAGLDVLEDENPDLSKCPFVGRENVILTPHAAFYSKNSMERLHKISGSNLGYLLAGEHNRVDAICSNV